MIDETQENFDFEWQMSKYRENTYLNPYYKGKSIDDFLEETKMGKD